MLNWSFASAEGRRHLFSIGARASTSGAAMRATFVMEEATCRTILFKTRFHPSSKGTVSAKQLSRSGIFSRRAAVGDSRICQVYKLDPSIFLSDYARNWPSHSAGG